MLRVIAILFTV